MTVEPLTAYCVECRTDRQVAGAERVEMPAEGGQSRPAVKGTCPVCGGGLFRILADDELESV
jgi:Zn finger protein HypA/HybF involved in hydrogenase expression